MNEFLYAILKSFQSLIKKEVSSKALLSGIAILVVWIFISIIIWHPLTALSAKILEFVPFTLIKSNGAWMLSSLLFIQVVFITFAFFVVILGNFIIKVSKESTYPLYLFILSFAIILFWSVIWLLYGNVIYSGLSKLMAWLPFETIEKSIANIFAFYMVYSLFVVSVLLYASIFSKNILNGAVDEEIDKVPEVKIMSYTLKDILVFLIVSILAFPVLFVPVVNILLQVFIWIWLVKDTFTYDVGLIFYKKDMLEKIKKEHKVPIYAIAFLASLFNFIPILNIFSPYFGEFAMYYYFDSLKNDI